MVSSLNACCADTWQRAEIYLIDWEMTTRVALTPQRVRELAKSRRAFREEASEIARLLALDKLKVQDEPRPEDARLVVDLYTDTGAKVTYYASRLNLCTADNASKHSLDAEFRKRFSELAKKPKEAKQSQ